MGEYTDFLFARPSFMEGAARVLDLGDTLTLYNGSLSEVEADELALLMDMYAIGVDLFAATEATAVTEGVALARPTE